MLSRIKQLYYITHIENIPSILKLGILSHSKIEPKGPLGFLKSRVKHTAIYDEEIISNRKNRKTPDNKSLWEYVNLYFQARNPMLYRARCEQSPERLAVLAVESSVLKLPGAFVTTGNAASMSSDIMPAEDYEKVIEELRDVINLEYWEDEYGSKRKIMAECLLPDKVAPNYIKVIYAASKQIAEEIKREISNEIPVIADPHMFFNNALVVQLSANLSVLRGDMFFSRKHTLSVSVNIVGVMGKGLASRAKYQFPDVYVLYQDLCRKKILGMGRPYLYKREISLDFKLADEPATLKNSNAETWFLLFPTKRHWKENANFEAIEQGMQWLKENYKKEQIKSLAIPALGCGLGRLRWKDVGPMLCKYLADFDIPVQLYLPAERQIPNQYITKDLLLSLR